MKNNFPALLKSSNTTRPKFFDFCFFFGFLDKSFVDTDGFKDIWTSIASFLMIYKGILSTVD